MVIHEGHDTAHTHVAVRRLPSAARAAGGLLLGATALWVCLDWRLGAGRLPLPGWADLSLVGRFTAGVFLVLGAGLLLRWRWVRKAAIALLILLTVMNSLLGGVLVLKTGMALQYVQHPPVTFDQVLGYYGLALALGTAFTVAIVWLLCRGPVVEALDHR